MLHIIIITASILNLGFKTIAPKILAHTTCINRYRTEIHTNISSKKSSKTYCKIKLAELTANHKLIKCWRPPTIHKIIIYIKMSAPCAKCWRPKCRRPMQNVGALKCRHLSKVSALMKYSKSKKQLRLYKIL